MTKITFVQQDGGGIETGSRQALDRVAFGKAMFGIDEHYREGLLLPSLRIKGMVLYLARAN